MARGAEDLVADWKHPVGTPVRYRRDDGSFITTRTRSEPHVLGGHTAVIWLEGHAGCFSLSRVEALPEEGR